ncbi:hypothetical protein D9M72_66810 [compost metagenome]
MIDWKASRSVASRTKILCTATPCGLKNCRLSDGGTPALAAASLTANPACQRLKNRRRSMTSPSASPIASLPDTFS